MSPPSVPWEIGLTTQIFGLPDRVKVIGDPNHRVTLDLRDTHLDQHQVSPRRQDPPDDSNLSVTHLAPSCALWIHQV